MLAPALVLASLTFLAPGSTPLRLGPPPSVLKLRRPAEGEWMGVYLLGKKAGYSFSKISTVRGPHGEKRLQAFEDTTLQATVGTKAVVRRIRETKIYKAKPGGALLSLNTLFEGDGGDYELAATFDAKGTHMIRTPKDGQPEKIELPATGETVESADLARYVIATRTGQKLDCFDSYELKTKHQIATYGGPTELVAGGAHATAEQVSVTEDDEKVAQKWAIESKTGRVLEYHFGGALLGVPEPEGLAKKLDLVDMFALTRVAVDKPLPSGVVPATVAYEVTGFPPGMRPESNRQTYRDLPSGAVELTVHAHATDKQSIRPAEIGPGLAPEVQAEIKQESPFHARRRERGARDCAAREEDCRRRARHLHRGGQALPVGLRPHQLRLRGVERPGHGRAQARRRRLHRACPALRLAGPRGGHPGPRGLWPGLRPGHRWRPRTAVARVGGDLRRRMGGH